MSSSSPNYLSELVQDFENALENEDYCDVIIKAGEDSDAKDLRAHSFVLRTRCTYFKRALSSDWEEKDDDGNFIFKKPNISPEIFQIILRYLYTGIIDYNRHNINVILSCLVAADELGLEKLIEHIKKYLSENEEILHKDPVTTLEFTYQHESFKSLKDHCLEIISEDPGILFSSQKLPSLEKPIVTMILQRDDLSMEEIDIWDSLIRWLFVHHLKIGKDDSTWSSEDLGNVKQTIQEYIPLIRFYDISKEDFYLKVYPYKDLLPQELLNDVLRYHMVPNSVPTFNFKTSRYRKSDSVLITSYDVFLLFAKWIDNKSIDYTRRSIPYKFKLLLRGTRDGFDATKFHQLCDNQGATISIARVKDSNQIIGGYNPLSWTNAGGSYLNTTESFLFKITDSSNLSSAQVSRCNNHGNAVYNHSSYGPTFGSGHDLRAQGNSWSASNGSSYSNISIPSSFTADEFEVFQVVKKLT